MGDEGLQIYNVGRLSAKFIDFVPWDTDEFEVSVRDLIVKKCKRHPIVILNDMVEQHYRKETIPKVSFLDRGNVLKRRLGVAFPNYRVRAALKLKDKEADSGKGGSYLFAAVPASDALNKVMSSVAQSMAPIMGFYLLPVEAAAMVKALSTRLNKSKRQKATWTIFVGQHHNGGLRQVVTRGGELALTRMTPIVDTDVEPELWAKEVSGELNATMSYLSRFGYKETDGLDIVVIANDSSQTSLEALVDIECNLHIVTAQKAAASLGVRLGRQEDFRYADPLHAAYLGKRNKFQLPMQSLAIERLTKPRRVASFLMLFLLAGCAYVGFNIVQNGKKSIQVKDELVVAVQQNQSLEEEYKLELEKKKAIGFDFLFVNNAIDIHKDLQEQKMKPLLVMREIGRSLGADLHLDKITFNIETEVGAENQDIYGYNPDESRQLNFILNSVMTISFPSTVNPDVGVQKINDLRDRLKGRLPDYNVNIIKQVADLSYTGNFVGEAGGVPSQEEVPENYDAEIRIRGRI